MPPTNCYGTNFHFITKGHERRRDSKEFISRYLTVRVLPSERDLPSLYNFISHFLVMMRIWSTARIWALRASCLMSEIPLAPWNEVKKTFFLLNYFCCLQDWWLAPCSAIDELCFPVVSFWRLPIVMKSVMTFPEGTHSFQPHAYISPTSVHKAVYSLAKQ